MGIMIPGELADLLNQLGYTWPKSDETALFELGSEWFSMGSDAFTVATEAEGIAQTVLSGNAGDSIRAFAELWHEEEGPLDVLRSGGAGASGVGGALIVCAGIVLALKINVIVQLTILLIQIIQAIAAAVATFGASLAWIPVAKEIAGRLINLLVDQAIGAVLG